MSSETRNAEKQSVHHKIGDVFIHLAPVITGWSFFTIFLVIVFLAVYWWTHPHNFIDLVFNSVNTIAGFMNLIMWLIILSISGFILNKICRGILDMIREIKEIVRPHPRVHAFNDKMAVYEGGLIVHDHQENKTVNHVKVTEDSASGMLQLPSPSDVPVPTGRQLLLDGSVERALTEGYLILGMGEDGKIKKLKIKRCFSTLISGLPSVGKTTTVFWITGQLTLIGAKLWIVDPHMYFEDEDGNKSLAKELAELSDSFVFPPCDGTPQHVVQRLKWMYQQLRKRQQPGYIVRAEQTIIGIMDEFNSVADSIDPKLVVIIHEGREMNFAQTLALVEREGRKYGLHFMLIGHKWAQQDIGGDNAVRTNATTYLCHRLNDQRQADLLLGSGQGKKILTLQVGRYWITGPTWNAEPAMITTPLISAADLPVLLQIKDRRIPVVNQANVIDATISAPVSTAISAPVSMLCQQVNSEYNIDRPGKQPDTEEGGAALPADLYPKTLMVMELDEQEKGQNEIVRVVWGCEPNTRQGQAATEELRQIRKYIALHHRKTMKMGGM